MKEIICLACLAFCIGLVSVSASYAQERCGFDEAFDQQLKELGMSRTQFADAFNQQINNVSQITGLDQRVLDDHVYEVPLVFHIMHTGEDPLESGNNLSDREIRELVNQINAAYAQTHNDVSNIPDRFTDVAAGDTKIRFKLATRDTLGLPTNGIVRTELDLPSTIKEHLINYAQDFSPIWNQELYINIYVFPPAFLAKAGHEILGQATLPLAQVPGLIHSVNDPRAGGGSRGSWVLINAGQTKERAALYAHELGHSLGLFHSFQSWSKGLPCDAERGDFCNDTPLAEDPLMNTAQRFAQTRNCKSSTCGTPDMVENYMDYTPLACQAMFTKCQASRMRSVLAHARNRESLVGDEGEDNPTLTALPDRENDVRIGYFNPADGGLCKETPELSGDFRIINRSQNNIESVKVKFLLNEQHLSQYDMTYTFADNLATAIDEGDFIPSYVNIPEYPENKSKYNVTPSGEVPVLYPFPNYPVPYRKVSFGPIPLNAADPSFTSGDYRFDIVVEEVNDQNDPYALNDTTGIRSYLVSKAQVSEVLGIEDFEDSNQISWAIPEAFRDEIKIVPTRDNSGHMLNFEIYNSDIKYQNRFILSPLIDASSLKDNEQLNLSFRYSYQAHPDRSLGLFYGLASGTAKEGAARGDCALDSILHLHSIQLTADVRTGLERLPDEKPFYESDWKTISMPLGRYSGQMNALLYLRNGIGTGNMYIDDIEFKIIPIASSPETALSVHNPVMPAISCNSEYYIFNVDYSNNSEDFIKTKDIWLRLTHNNSDPSKSTWLPLDGLPNSGRDLIFEKRDPSVRTDSIPHLRSSKILVTVPAEDFTGLSKGTVEFVVSSEGEPDQNVDVGESRRTSETTFSSVIKIESRRLPYVDNGKEGSKSFKDATTLNTDLQWKHARAVSGNYLYRAPLFDRSKNDEQPFFRFFSPQISLDGLESAVVNFQISYAPISGSMNRLRLFVFEDCVPAPSELLFNKAGSELATAQETDQAWFPLETSDWRQESVDLSKYVGKDIHLLFVATSEEGPGNNIYIDNIQVGDNNIESIPLPKPSGGEGSLDDPDKEVKDQLVGISVNPSSAENLEFLFKLSANQDVNVSFIDTAGRVVWDKTLENISTGKHLLSPNIDGDQLYFVKFEFEKDKTTKILRQIIE